MTYTRHPWVNDASPPLSAAVLTEIEDGIVNEEAARIDSDTALTDSIEDINTGLESKVGKSGDTMTGLLGIDGGLRLTGGKMLLSGDAFNSEYDDDVLQLGTPMLGLDYNFGADYAHNNGVVASFNIATGTGGYRANIKAESWLDPTGNGSQGIYPFLGIGHMRGPYDLSGDYVDGGDFIALHEGTGNVWSSYGVRAQAYNNNSGSYDFMAGLHAIAHNYRTGGGTIANMAGVSVSLGDYGAANITKLSGLEVRALSVIDGTSVIEQAYGVYVGDLLDGIHTNPPYAVYTDGSTRSRFGGPVSISGSATPALTLQAAAGSYADQTQWKDSDGAVVARMFFNGALRTSYQTVENGLSTGYLNDVDGYGPYFQFLTDKVTLTSSGITQVPLTIIGVAGQSADVLQLQSSAGVNLLSVAPAGDLELWSAAKGIILKSDNGTRYRITVDNSGTLITTAA